MPGKIDGSLEAHHAVSVLVSVLPFIVVILGFKKIHGLIKGSGNQDKYASKVEVREAEVEIRENRIPGGDDTDAEM